MTAIRFGAKPQYKSLANRTTAQSHQAVSSAAADPVAELSQPKFYSPLTASMAPGALAQIRANAPKKPLLKKPGWLKKPGRLHMPKTSTGKALMAAITGTAIWAPVSYTLFERADAARQITHQVWQTVQNTTGSNHGWTATVARADNPAVRQRLDKMFQTVQAQLAQSATPDEAAILKAYCPNMSQADQQTTLEMLDACSDGGNNLFNLLQMYGAWDRNVLAKQGIPVKTRDAIHDNLARLYSQAGAQNNLGRFLLFGIIVGWMFTFVHIVDEAKRKAANPPPPEPSGAPPPPPPPTPPPSAQALPEFI